MNKQFSNQFSKLDTKNWSMGGVQKTNGAHGQANGINLSYAGAFDLYKANDYFGSLKLVKKLLKKNKRNIELLNLAGINYLASGDLERASAYFLKILKINPGFNEARCNLGNVYFKKGNYSKAKELFYSVIKNDQNHNTALNNVIVLSLKDENIVIEKFVIENLLAISQKDPEALFNIASFYKKNSDLRKASIFYLKSIKAGNRSENAYHNLGKCLHVLGKNLSAKAVIVSGLRLYPNSKDLKMLEYFVGQSLGQKDDAETLKNKLVDDGVLSTDELNKMAVEMIKQGHFDEGNALFDAALTKDPYSFETYLNKGISLRTEKKYDAAAIHFLKSLEINKYFFDAYDQLGHLFVEMERYTEALDVFEKALVLKPNCTKTKTNIAHVHHQIGNIDQAISIYTEMCDLEPDNYISHNNLSVIYRQRGDDKSAKEVLLKLLRVKPDMVEGLLNLSGVYTDLGELDMAVETFDRLLAISDKLPHVKGKLLHQLHHMNDFDELKKRNISISEEELVDDAAAAPSPFDLLPIVDAHKQKLAARKFTKSLYQVNDPIQMPFTNRNGDGARIRIGYFSSDFFNHATMHLMRKIFEHHDRSKFEIFVYCLNEADDNDPYTKYLLDNVEHFYPVKFVSDREIAKLARTHGIDIAVDLKGYTKDCRTKIFAYRAAPIQINYLGYPGTMGADFMDYILADEVVIPVQHFQHYDEKVLHIPGSYQVNDIDKPISRKETQRSDWGIPDDAVVLACFNNNYKITDKELTIWMRILKKHSNAILWLFEGNKFSHINITNFASDHGVDPGRIIFAPKVVLQEHLERHKHIDIFLDTFGYNAHTTASDALWCEVPLVTLEGETFCSRVASSILKSMVLDDLVAKSEKQYEEIISELLVSNSKRMEIVSRIQNVKNIPGNLFDVKSFTQNLEELYEGIIKEN